MPEHGENHVRFWRGGWRKAICSVCWCIVPKSKIDAHATYHVARGEGQERRLGAYGVHNDVTVINDDDCTYAIHTGWVTDNTGPL